MTNDLHPLIAECLSPFTPTPAGRSLNDDDIYIVHLRTRTIVQEHSGSSVSAQLARTQGLPCKLGYAVLTGMQVRCLGQVS